MSSKRLGFLALLLVAVFAGTRTMLHWGLRPYLDADSLKYLGGADALFGGAPLPPLFEALRITGGGLHAVPGYPWFMHAVWRVAGGISLDVLAAANSIFALLGYLAAAHLAARVAGAGTGLLVLALLVTAPPLAFLEYTIMPDVLAAPLTLIACWLAVMSGPARSVAPALGTALASGAIMAAGILMRTASQVFVPLPVMLAATSQRSWRRRAGWLGCYAVALAVTFAPWMMHNLETHGVYRLTASTGRNLYFSSLWSGTLDRAVEGAALGVTRVGLMGSVGITDAAFRRQLARGLSFSEADRELATQALSAWQANAPQPLIRQRLRIVWGLFDERLPEAVTLRSLRSRLDIYLKNDMYQELGTSWAESRFKHSFSEELTAEMAAQHATRSGKATFSRWVQLLTLEGIPLLCLFLVCVPLAVLLAGDRWLAWWVFAAPPLAYLAMFAAFGAPLYRYQASLHPFMLSTIGLAVGLAVRRTLATATSSATGRLRNRTSHDPEGAPPPTPDEEEQAHTPA